MSKFIKWAEPGNNEELRTTSKSFSQKGLIYAEDFNNVFYQTTNLLAAAIGASDDSDFDADALLTKLNGISNTATTAVNDLKTNLTDGSLTVNKATSADSATSATTVSGNISNLKITDIFEKSSDALIATVKSATTATTATTATWANNIAVSSLINGTFDSSGNLSDSKSLSAGYYYVELDTTGAKDTSSALPKKVYGTLIRADTGNTLQNSWDKTVVIPLSDQLVATLDLESSQLGSGTTAIEKFTAKLKITIVYATSTYMTDYSGIKLSVFNF